MSEEVGAEAGLSCDWHDNFGFEDARRRLEMESARLRDLLSILDRSHLIEVAEQTKEISIGNKVSVSIDDKKRQFIIGGIFEADPKRGIVSLDSPIVSILLGHATGDIFDATLAGTKVKVEILEILPPSLGYFLIIGE